MAAYVYACVRAWVKWTHIAKVARRKIVTLRRRTRTFLNDPGPLSQPLRMTRLGKHRAPALSITANLLNVTVVLATVTVIGPSLRDRRLEPSMSPLRRGWPSCLAIRPRSPASRDSVTGLSFAVVSGRGWVFSIGHLGFGGGRFPWVWRCSGTN